MKAESNGGRRAAGLPGTIHITTHECTAQPRPADRTPGQDPERIEFDGDKVKVNLRLTSEVSNAGEKTETTQWHNIIAMGQLAEILSRYLSKGSEVAVRPAGHRQYEDRSGQSRVAPEIVTQEMLMLDRVPQEA